MILAIIPAWGRVEETPFALFTGEVNHHPSTTGYFVGFW